METVFVILGWMFVAAMVIIPIMSIFGAIKLGLVFSSFIEHHKEKIEQEKNNE